MLDSIWPAGPREREEGPAQNLNCVRLSNPVLLSVKGRRIKNSCYIYWGGGWRRGEKATPVFDGFGGRLPRLGPVTLKAGSLLFSLKISLFLSSHNLSLIISFSTFIISYSHNLSLSLFLTSLLPFFFSLLDSNAGTGVREPAPSGFGLTCAHFAHSCVCIRKLTSAWELCTIGPSWGSGGNSGYPGPG